MQLLLLIALAFALVAWPANLPAQIEIIPGSSVRGAVLFEQKGCVECHAFGGVGGRLAFDLAPQNGRPHTPMQLATALWNHAPEMWRAQQARQIRPTLDSMETADLFAYFYSLSYLSAPGNAASGRALFEEKGCASCHQTTESRIPGRRRNTAGPPISAWANVQDPLGWAEQMWNHSRKVSEDFSRTNFSWPQFSTQQMLDLLAYFRSELQAGAESAVFQPGNPEQGRITFERTCESCHSFGDREAADRKIDLLKRAGPDVLTGYVAAMWNHAPMMHSRAGQDFPILGPGDMSNLVAYLFAERYFYEDGNAQNGALLFQTKNCASCHEQRRRQTGAPDLALATERYSPITMSAATWRHGPAMYKAIEGESLSWPKLKPSEMADLITFLNSRLVPRVAAGHIDPER